MQVVAIVERFQGTPVQIHLLTAKRTLWYLRETIDYGLWYPRGKYFPFNVYTNVDWLGDMDDWKSTSYGAFFLGEFLVSWLSKKQSLISLSIAEEEYITTSSCCTQLLSMKKNLKYVQVHVD